MVRSQRGRIAGTKSQKKPRKPSARKPLSEVLEERQLLASDLASSVCTGGVLTGTCTETESFSGVPDLSDAAIFDQFDPSLGTLLSVKVSLELTSDGGSFEADNDSNEPATFDVNFGAEGDLSSSDVGLFSAITPVPVPVVAGVSTSQGATFTLTGNDGDPVDVFNQGGTDWDRFEGVAATASSMGEIDSSLFAGYTGTGTFEIDYDVDQVADTTSAGGVFRQIGPVSASGSITVTYEYDIPFNPAIDIDKYIWDINGSPEITTDISVGDELLYGFEVTNTGDVPLTNVTVTDALPGVTIGSDVFSPGDVVSQPTFIPADGVLGPFASVDRELVSDPYEAKAWDNFTLSGETVLTGLDWAGAYIEPFSVGETPQTDFWVEIYGADAGQPGSLFYSWTLDGGDAGVSDGDVTSTLLGHTAEEGGPVYHYSADLSKTVLPAGNYWISITALQTFPNPFPKIDPTWQWHLGSGSGDGFYTYDDTFDDPGDNGIGIVDGTPTPAVFDPDKDLAFTLKGKQETSFDGTLNPGETVVFTGTYIVTLDDVLNLQVENTATVTGDDPLGDPITDDDTEVVIIDKPEPSIDIDKYLWDINGSPALHTNILPGDELIYAFDVTNTGETKLSNVTVTDALPGVVIDAEVAVPYVAVDQPIFIPADGNLGPFASVESTVASDDMEAKAWDNFTLSGETVLDGIAWSGAYIEPFAAGLVPETDFLVEIFADSSGSPGTLAHSFSLEGGLAGVSDGNVTSTLLGHSAFDGGPVYSYEALLPFTLMPAGDYWISIMAEQTFPNPAPVIDPTWQWHLGTGPGDGFYSYDDAFDDVGDGTPFPATKTDGKDLAYTLHAAELQPFDGMLEPGETVMFMGTYIVTIDDVLSGEIVNKGTVTADDPFGDPVMDMDTETVPIDMPESDIDIDKYLWDINGLPDLHTNINVGDELIYSFDVTNTGETKLTNVDVTDSLPGAVFDPQVVVPFTAFDQPWTLPADGNLGPFSSVDRTMASDDQEAKAWDNFSFAEDTVVDGVSWVGAYIEPFATGDGVLTPETDFVLEIWSDNAGPDSVLHSFTVRGGEAGVDDAQVTTTALGHTASDGGPVFAYEALFPFTYLVAGDYWISITAEQTFPNAAPTIDPTWQWHLGSGAGDGFYSYDDVFDDVGDGTPNPVNFQTGKDLSFKLHGAELVDFDGMLDPGETVMFMATYIVTADDVLAGEVINKGTVTADDPFGETVMDMDTEEVKIDIPESSIDVDKYLWDINGSPNLTTFIKPGDELIYSLDVTNTGDTKLSNVEVTDSLPGAVFDEQIVIPFTAFEQPAFVPADGNLGPFSSVDRSLTSDDQEAKAWDNFSFAEDTVIDAVTWSGAYVEPFASGDGVLTPETDFLIEIYGDTSGSPDSLLHSFTAIGGDAGVNDAQVTTTLLSHTSSDGGPAYSYSAMFPFTYLVAGDYWLSITALQTFPNAAPTIDPTWLWHLGSGSGDGFYSYDDVFDDAGDGTPSPVNFTADKDLAFKLHGAEQQDFDGMLEPGEKVMFMVTYYATEEDVAAGEIVNKGTVTADDPLGREVMDMDTETVIIETPNSSIDIDKYLWDINGSPNLHTNIMVGDELIYSFDVTNTGETKLSGVEVTDSLPDAVFDDEIVVPFVAYEQPWEVPADGNLGPFSSVDRTLASDPFEAKAWDNFSFSTDTVIDGVSWTGAYVEPFATGDGVVTPKTDFLIEIYADDSGPGSLLHSFTANGGDAGVNDALVVTTPLGHTAEDGGPVYNYSAMFPFTYMVAGDYWLSVTALQTFPNPEPTIDPTWQWHLGSKSTGADGFYSYDDAFDDAGDGTPSPLVYQAGKDLAFKLHGAELQEFDGMLEPGEKAMFMATYYVTAEDVANGGVTNKGTVTAHDPFGNTVMDMDTHEVEITTPPADPSISIDKYLWDINGSPDLHNDIQVGDELIYGLDVINTGNVELTNVVVTDQVFRVTVDEEVAIPYIAVDQPAFVPSSGSVGAFSSVDRTLSSDPQEAKAWDNFTLTDDWTVIDAIDWYGAYAEPFADGSSPETDFLIEIAEPNTDAKPGSTLHSFLVRGGVAGVDDVNVRTTLLSHTTPDGGPVYQYFAMLPFTGLVAGDYFISITALQTFPSSSPTIDPTWQWHLGSGPGDGFYTYDDVFDDAVDGTPFAANLEADKDLAFTLHAARLIDDFDGVLAPGERVMYMARYIVRQEDVDKGLFQNDGKVEALAPDGTMLTELDWEKVFINQNPGIKLSAAPAPGDSGQVAAQTDGMLDMRYTVTNDGNVSLQEVVVTDEAEGDATYVSGDVGEDGVMSPGEVWTFEGMGQNGMEAKVTSETTLGEMVTDQLMHDFCVPSNGDIDGDGQVAFSDFLTLSRNFGATEADASMGDLDCDGQVAFSDFLTLSRNFGTSTIAGEATAAAATANAADAAFGDSDDDDDWLA